MSSTLRKKQELLAMILLFATVALVVSVDKGDKTSPVDQVQQSQSVAKQNQVTVNKVDNIANTENKTITVDNKIEKAKTESGKTENKATETKSLEANKKDKTLDLELNLSPKELQAMQKVNSLNWVQTSGEFRALNFQAFNFAKIIFAAHNAKEDEVKVVISDVDETLISNADRYSAEVLASSPLKEYKGESKIPERALPGSLEFTHYVANNGGKMLYVTNRKNHEKTIALLQRLGFPGVSKETVFTREKTSSKLERFAQGSKFGQVVLYLGDNLRDFPDFVNLDSAKEREIAVDNKAFLFGTRYVIMANPINGSWTKYISQDKNFSSLSLAEQNQAKVDSIQAWDNFPKQKAENK